MTYEGHTNYETYIVSTWIANDEAAYNWWGAIAAELDDKLRLVDKLKATLESEMPVLEGVWADLLNGAFNEVDWYDVADSLMW